MAVQRTAAELRPRDAKQAEHIALVINHVFSEPMQDAPLVQQATLLEAMQAAIAGQLAVLDDASLTGSTGQSSADVLGVSGTELAAKLTGHLLQEVVARGSRGGPLGPLANQLNHDVTHDLLIALERRLAEDGGQTSAVQLLSWPRQIGVVPRLAGFFQQRPQAGELALLLAEGGAAVPCQVVSGPGGVGKSQLAAQFAHGLWENSVGKGGTAEAATVDLVMWVNAGSPRSVRDAYAQAAAEVTGDAGGEGDRDQSAQRFLAWLRSTERTWLVVLDDVATPGDLNGLWPPDRPGGRVIVTTRSRDSAWQTRTRHRLDVGVFTPAEASAYLAEALHRPERTRHFDTVEDIASLAAGLGQLPLALAQAAAYLVDAGISIPAYQALLADRAGTLDEALPQVGHLPDEHSRTVSALWDTSIGYADRCAPEGIARPLLQLISLLDGSGIPVEILTARPVLIYLVRVSGPSTAQAVRSPARSVLAGLRVLDRLNLIDHAPADSNGLVRIHQLIQRAVREGQGGSGTPPFLILAADALVAAWPEAEPDQVHAQRLRDNASSVESLDDEQALWARGAHELFFRHGQSLGEAGAVAAAIDYYRHLHATAQRILGPDHPDTLTTRLDLAFWRGEAGNPADAVEALEDLLADRIRVLGTAHPDALITRNKIAHWRGEGGDPAAAVAILEELLADQERVLGPEHADTLTTRVNLCGWRSSAGDVQTAARDFEELLGDLDRILGPDHHQTLIARGNLAQCRGALGDIEAAIRGNTQVLEAKVRTIGPDHPDTLAIRHNLARWQGRAGDPAGAVNALRILLVDRVRVLGSDHPDTLATRQDLASWQGEAGEPANAVRALEELLADQLRVLGPENRQSAATTQQLSHWQARAAESGSHPNNS